MILNFSEKSRVFLLFPPRPKHSKFFSLPEFPIFCGSGKVPSIPSEKISCVDFVFDVIEDFVVAVYDDRVTACFEFFDVVDDCVSLIVNGSRG